jgi:hypothetical protein
MLFLLFWAKIYPLWPENESIHTCVQTICSFLFQKYRVYMCTPVSISWVRPWLMAKVELTAIKLFCRELEGRLRQNTSLPWAFLWLTAKCCLPNKQLYCESFYGWWQNTFFPSHNEFVANDIQNRIWIHNFFYYPQTTCATQANF